MKQQHSFKVILIGFLIIFLTGSAIAQVPPEGKYNTASYPQDRKAIEALDNIKDNSKYLANDYIAIGPEGKIYYALKEWQQSFKDMGVTFKSIMPVPETSILRIYNGDAAVRNRMLNVALATPKGDTAITLVLRETFIKQAGKWYVVSVQGTNQMSEADQQNLKAGSILKDSIDVAAVVPPLGKFSDSSYPEDRKMINAPRNLNDSTAYHDDDYIAVGPEGKVSYGKAQWQQGFKHVNVKFKSVAMVKDATVLRIYNGDAAIKNFVADVVADTPKGDMYLTVMRSETYIKINGQWYFVGGQGTKLASVNN